MIVLIYSISALGMLMGSFFFIKQKYCKAFWFVISSLIIINISLWIPIFKFINDNM